ncbi:DNA polymerase III subunit delta' [Propionivibrio sp.]|uniref:DNA polymerase III subunit delta' n=1 Tax=Propionivibrio sp. TaxID=2212460 RepID=UPI00272DD1A5|nr:DNA polymerase III subunit delta' [Propionivibrio sp.]
MNVIDLHEEVWKRLGARRANLPHALLLTGPRGIGKFALARSFAESLLCENPSVSQVACGACLACGWLQQGNHPDFRLIQPEAMDDGEEAASGAAAGTKKKPSQQITIDQIRGLDEFLHVGTHRHGVRIVLICPAEAMNRSTANSLLKSLEEPSSSTLFLLVSDDSERLLPTIRSRCQHLPVTVPEHARATAWVADAGVDDPARWLALAGGAPFLAVELGGGEERVLVDALVAELAKGRQLDPMGTAAAIDKVIKAEKRPVPLKRAVEWIQKWLADLLLLKVGGEPRYFTAQVSVLRESCRFTSLSGVLAFSRKALQYRQHCEQPVNSRLFFEDVFLNYAALFSSDRDSN